MRKNFPNRITSGVMSCGLLVGAYGAGPAPAAMAVPTTAAGTVAEATALSSHRVVDTRVGLGHDGVVPGGTEFTFSVADVPGFAPEIWGATVSLNLTATEASEPGFMSVFSTGGNRPITSNLNYTPGVNIANHVIAQADSSGDITIYVHGTTHVVVDVTAVHSEAMGFGIPPMTGRVVDTRESGTPVAAGSITTVNPHDSLFPEMLEPPQAWILNVTATESTEPGFLNVYAAGTPWPNTSTVNYVAGQTIAGLTIAEHGSDQGVAVYSHGQTHLIVDVLGWVARDGSYVKTTPARALDSRAGGAPPLPSGSYTTINPTAHGVPQGAASAVLANLTVTAGREQGYLTAFRSTAPRPDTSMLNYSVGQTIANSAFVPLAEDGTFRVYNHGNTHLVVDIVGYVIGTPEDGEVVVLTDTSLAGVPFPFPEDHAWSMTAQFGRDDFWMPHPACDLAGVAPGFMRWWQGFYLNSGFGEDGEPVQIRHWTITDNNLPGMLTPEAPPMIGASFEELQTTVPGLTDDRAEGREAATGGFYANKPGTEYYWWITTVDSRQVVDHMTNARMYCDE